MSCPRDPSQITSSPLRGSRLAVQYESMGITSPEKEMNGRRGARPLPLLFPMRARVRADKHALTRSYSLTRAHTDRQQESTSIKQSDLHLNNFYTPPPPYSRALAHLHASTQRTMDQRGGVYAVSLRHTIS